MWHDRSTLFPLDPCNISVELVREIEDEETGELIEEQLIDVSGRFLPEENDVGLGAHIEVHSAHLQSKQGRGEVELTDWEVDSLLGLFQEQLRTEHDRDF